MGCIIDTCIIVNSERNSSDIKARLSGLEDDFFYISVISVSELLYGVHKASTGNQKNKRTVFVEDVLKKIPVVPIDISVARKHSELWANLSSKGIMIGAHDMWIAATCLAYGHRLLTDNKDEFTRIANLKLI